MLAGYTYVHRQIVLRAHDENVNKIINHNLYVGIFIVTSFYKPADPSQGRSETVKSNSIGQVMVGSNTMAHISTNPASSSTR